jgi:hypothetical protein
VEREERREGMHCCGVGMVDGSREKQDRRGKLKI